MPPGFGREYADRQEMQQRLEAALVGSDLDRRSGLMQNIISNAPNIAALSGVGTVDQLANMFADSEAPIFNNEYGQQGDMLNRQMQMAQLANATRPRGGGGGSGGGAADGGIPAGVNIDPNTVPVIITNPDGQSIRTVMDFNTFVQTQAEAGKSGVTVQMDFFGTNPYTNTTNKAGIPEVTASGVDATQGGGGQQIAPIAQTQNADGTITYRFADGSEITE